MLFRSLPDVDEHNWCTESLARQTALFQKAGHSADDAARRALANLCQTLWGTSEFLYLR